MRPLVLGLLLAFVPILSGCVGEDAAPAQADLPPDAIVSVDPDTGEAVVLQRYSTGLGVPEVAVTENFTGSFGAAEAWQVVGRPLFAAGMDAGSVRLHDISEMVPKEVPVLVSVEVRSDLQQGDLDLWIQVPQEEVWTSAGDTPRGGFSRIEQMIVHSSDEPIEVGVFYDEVEPAQTIDYTLTVSVTLDPWCIPSGVPMTLPVPKDAVSLEVTWDGGAGGPVWIWDPKDQLIGVLQPVDGVINHTFARGERGGDYVLMVPQPVPMAKVRVYAPASGEEAKGLVFGTVKQDIQSTEPETFSAGQDGAAFSVDVPKAPIQAGVFVVLETFTKSVSLKLDSPAGNLVDLSFSGNNGAPFVNQNPNGPMMFWGITPMGDDGLVPGAYTGSFAGEYNGDGAVAAFIVHYAR